MSVIESRQPSQRKAIRTTFCITYTARMEQPKNKGGRPPKDPSDRLEQRSHRLLPAHWQEFDTLGGIEWLREQLAKSLRKRQRAKPPAG